MISVIVPSYNVAPYLERCVNSLVRQTYIELEIILVDDGSTDETGELCEKLSQNDSRIKVIHKENGGLSDARNAGIDIATGEFYSFIDGDDFIELDTYEAMLAEMKDPAVSIVAGGFFVTDIKGNTTISMSPKRQYYTKEEAFMDLFGKSYISQSSCNKLFRSSLFDNIRYKKGILNEDMEILPRLLDAGSHVVLLDKAVYHYIKKPGSITSADYSMERYKAIEIEKDIYRLCKTKYPKLKPYAGYYELKSLYEMLLNLMECNNHKDFKIQELSIRRRIILVSIRCSRWKEITNIYKNQMKTYILTALAGPSNIEKLVRIKHKIARD
ncbi:MAG: glycosyltransferase family 2 protein [Bacillota bacterium]|nr:glycosyltransferase family 2 protein [Bacillota bacterium]